MTDYLEEKFDDALARAAWDEALTWLDLLGEDVSKEQYEKLKARYYHLRNRL